jgi:hypothetical protein
MKDGLEYAWIDTCCIDKTNAVELSEAINSMFQWYSNASICYTYLSDVPTGDDVRDPSSKFFSSRWFRRGWTLQELLAPRELQFFSSTWSFLGTRSELSVMVQNITGIPRPFLLGWASLQEASVAQRMSWAAMRVTKRKEDVAYCLLGIFGVMMPMIYGEGDQAFRRLQEEIMKHTRDDSILAWDFEPAEPIPNNSAVAAPGGVLAASPSDFKDCGQIVSLEQYTESLSSFEISGGRLRTQLTLSTTPANEVYALLNCGLEHNTDQVVGIPLHNAASGSPSDEYVRPLGRRSVLLPKATSNISSKLIHIRRDRQSSTTAMNRRHWFFIEEPVNPDLELIEVEPQARWHKDRGMIATANELEGNIIQRTATRFRSKSGGSRDFVVILEFEVKRSQVQTRCHVMTSSRDTSLKDLVQKLIYIRQEAFGKQSGSDGILNVNVTVGQELIIRQPMFVIRLAAMASPPEITIDATSELQQLDLTFRYSRILQEEGKVHLEMKQFGQHKEEKATDLGSLLEQRAIVEEEVRKVKEELIKLESKGRLLDDKIKTRTQEVFQFTIRG